MSRVLPLRDGLILAKMAFAQHANRSRQHRIEQDHHTIQYLRK
jgi:hypothetical protein